MNPSATLTPLEAGTLLISGVLDFAAVARLASEGRAWLRAAVAEGRTSVVVDLSGVERANSAGLALLLEWLEVAHAGGLSLSYVHLPESLQRLAAVSNLDAVLPVASFKPPAAGLQPLVNPDTECQ